jgi:hypothetical protein
VVANSALVRQRETRLGISTLSQIRIPLYVIPIDRKRSGIFCQIGIWCLWNLRAAKIKGLQCR